MSAKDVCIKTGSFCPVCRGIVLADCYHSAGDFHIPRYTRDPELVAALAGVVSSLEEFGEWDEGCFYYQGRSAAELEGPLEIARAAIAKAKGVQ